MKLRLAACISLGLVTALSAAQTSPAKPAISPMRAIYVQDQRDRGVRIADNGDALKPGETAPPAKDLSWDEITKRDEERRKQVNSLLAEGKAVTAQDFHDAAFIFQHGQTTDDFLLAHILATEAIVLGDTTAKWIAAATLDRYLQMIGQKQVFGTQYGDTKFAYYIQHKNDPDVLEKFKTIPSAKTLEPYNDKLLSDTIRKDFCVPDVSVQQKYVDDINAGRDADIPRVANCRR
jgi:hypothetical protein